MFCSNDTQASHFSQGCFIPDYSYLLASRLLHRTVYLMVQLLHTSLAGKQHVREFTWKRRKSLTEEGF